MKVRGRAGFTLLEAMIVLAIIGVLAAMAASTAAGIGARNAAQNASSELGSMLQLARARAEQTGSDVYVIIYPSMQRNGLLTGGHGAVFVYEDANGNFLTSVGACDGSGTVDCGWSNFAPPNSIRPPATSRDRIVATYYLDDAPKQNVRFGKPSTVLFKLPFAGVGATADSSGCSFCSSNKGAIVFTGEQQLRFIDGSANAVGQRVAGLALQAIDAPQNTFLFGLARSTGLVTLVK